MTKLTSTERTSVEIAVPLQVSELSRILIVAANTPNVHADVRDNYWNNRWWPVEIRDWRLKILFAGLSTRVNYKAITKYQSVRDELAHHGFDGLLTLSSRRFMDIVTPLGLAESRWKFWESLKTFATSFPNTSDVPPQLQKLSNDDHIEFLQKNIKGVGYKVAEGSTLYIRGYHCGIIPVDSGMKDLLGPCLGFETSGTARGHEQMRKQLERLASKLDFPVLLTATGFQDILAEMKDGQINTWWVHLTLIYFKRRYCNLHDSSKCPLTKDPSLDCRMKYTCMELKK
jgi:hypothetical protein